MLNIPHAARMPWQGRRQGLAGRALGRAGKVWMPQHLPVTGAGTVEGRIAPHEVEQAAKDREEQNDDNPGNLVCRVVILADQPDHHDGADDVANAVDPHPAQADKADKPYHKRHLQRQEQAPHNAAVTYQFSDFLQHSSSKKTLFSPVIIINRPPIKVNGGNCKLSLKSCAYWPLSRLRKVFSL